MNKASLKCQRNFPTRFRNFTFCWILRNCAKMYQDLCYTARQAWTPWLVVILRLNFHWSVKSQCVGCGRYNNVRTGPTGLHTGPTGNSDPADLNTVSPTGLTILNTPVWPPNPEVWCLNYQLLSVFYTGIKYLTLLMGTRTCTTYRVTQTFIHTQGDSNINRGVQVFIHDIQGVIKIYKIQGVSYIQSTYR